MELADGVFDLPVTLDTDGGERVFHPSAVELPDGGVLLVDAGFAHTLDQLEAGLAEHGHSLDDVRYVLLTHQDGDHAGGLAPLCDRLEHPVTVFAHRDDAPVVEGLADPVKGDPDDRYAPAPVDVQVVDGVELRTAVGPLQVVATPGHTPGHVSCYLPDTGVLLAADATVAEDGELVGPAERFTPEVARAYESLGRLAELAFTDVLCYHGGHVEAGPERFRELVADAEE
ncbi:hydrolase [Halarchaeum grantii]|uniref:Hydrolase n=1 Tax=Halarchaeum grantii TaxID=1193105 RepID=A0A830EYV1_9EURY|nr:MBL fold metallo-hydrolase [Halarchaeum grantii]GGL23256.1 hydrolase [Halarchaeum grantii]